MTSTAAAAFRAELDEALAVLIPQIIGMESLANDSLTPEAIAALQQEDQDRLRRRGLIQSVLSNMDALEADGYPEMPKGEVSAAVIAELKRQQAAIAAAIAEFEELPPASNIAVDLGTPSDKPQA